jgi:hypothetical protein
MITLENISTGEVFEGQELEYFVDDETLIGEVYLDGDLVFQALDVLNDHQLDHALRLDFKVLKEEADIFSDFNQ